VSFYRRVACAGRVRADRTGVKERTFALYSACFIIVREYRESEGDIRPDIIPCDASVETHHSIAGTLHHRHPRPMTPAVAQANGHTKCDLRKSTRPTDQGGRNCLPDVSPLPHGVR
jgi:hypothetical protein